MNIKTDCPFCKFTCNNINCCYTVKAYMNDKKFRRTIMKDFLLKLMPSKKTAILNGGAFLVFLFPLLVYATAQDLKLDLITIIAPFAYGIFFEKSKSFIKEKISYFGE